MTNVYEVKVFPTESKQPILVYYNRSREKTNSYTYMRIFKFLHPLPFVNSKVKSKHLKTLRDQ
jgi:hypothetical protein